MHAAVGLGVAFTFQFKPVVHCLFPFRKHATAAARGPGPHAAAAEVRGAPEIQGVFSW